MYIFRNLVHAVVKDYWDSLFQIRDNLGNCWVGDSVKEGQMSRNLANKQIVGAALPCMKGSLCSHRLDMLQPGLGVQGSNSGLCRSCWRGLGQLQHGLPASCLLFEEKHYSIGLQINLAVLHVAASYLEPLLSGFASLWAHLLYKVALVTGLLYFLAAG